MTKTLVTKRGTVQAQEAIRLKVVRYLQKKLGTQNQCAEVFELSERSVNRIWSKYKQGGNRSLNNKKRGVQGGKKINGKQSAEVLKLTKDKLPDQMKLPLVCGQEKQYNN